MEWLNINNLIDEAKSYLHVNPEKFYVIVGIAGAVLLLLLILIALVVVAVKRKRHNEVDENEQLIKETLAEQEAPVVEETPAEEAVAEQPVEEVVEEQPVEEVVEEPAVEEKKPAKKATKKRTKKAEKPVEETPAEEPIAEEVVEEVVEEQPVEEPVVEETTEEPVVEEKKPAKKTTRKSNKKVEETPVVEEKKPRVVYGKYEVYTDGTSYYYNLKASNGEILIKSEPYASKDSVLLAVEAIKRNVEVGSISVRQDKHGLYQFVLTAKNHRVLVMSANYSTEKRAESASQSFKRFAPNSPVVEIEEVVESNKEEVKPENIVDKKGGRLGVLSNENGYYYVLKASNGEVLVTSDYFKLESSALNAMDRFKEAVFNGKFYIEMDKRENYQFKLFAANGRLVCVGQIYATKALAMASLNSVCSFVKLALPFEE